MIDRLSLVQPRPTSRTFPDTSRTFTGSPPANGTTAILFAFACASIYRSATNRASGDTAAELADSPEICSGDPPSSSTFQKVNLPCFNDLYTSHLPSAVHCGWESLSVPCVSCFCSPLTRSSLQIWKLPDRFELKTA